MINNYEIREERQEALGSFHTSVDNYLQYAPIVFTYGLNALGVKGEHDFANRTALLIKSELFMLALTYPMKQLSAVGRPDTGQKNSFPSGHTAQAFAAATFMHKEYGKKNPLYSVLAYGMATGVGLMRIANNRHWTSDVIAGAGIGILSTNLAYLTHQNKWGKSSRRSSEPGRPTTQLIVAPSYNQQALGISSVLFIR
jgi:membrane-associated phospholipid phosphatase